jgi:hypothetical protein
MVAMSAPASLAGSGTTPDVSGLKRHLKRHCDWAERAWCRLPGAASDATFTRAEARAWFGGDQAAVDRLWGWGGPRQAYSAYSGAAFDGRRFYFFGGGHHHYRGNDLRTYDLKTLSFERLYDPSYVTTETYQGSKRYLPRHGPKATHTYGAFVYVPGRDALYLWGTGVRHPWRFDLAQFRRDGDPWSAWRSVPSPLGENARRPLARNYRAAVTDGGKILLHYGNGGGSAYTFAPEAGRYVPGGSIPAMRMGTLRWVPDENAAFTVYGRTLLAYGPNGTVKTKAKLPGPQAFGWRHQADKGWCCDHRVGIAHDPGEDAVFLWDGSGRVVAYDYVDDSWRLYGRRKAPDGPQGWPTGIWGKWRYVPQADVFVGLAKTDSGLGMWAWKQPAEAGGGAQQDALKEKRREQGYSCSDEVAGWTCPDLQAQIDQGKVKRGVYTQCGKVTRPVDFNGAWLKDSVCRRKASLIAEDGAVIEDVRITGPTIGQNANCVRWQGGTVKLDGVTCRRADMGILGFGRELAIVDSTIAETRNGGSNHGHLVYACPRKARGATLTIRDSTLKAPGDEGHVLKTGCSETVIRDSRLDGGDGPYSRVIDAFNGGVLDIRDSALIAGPNGGNGDLIGFNGESRMELPRHTLAIRGGRVDCQGLPAWGYTLHTWADKPAPERIVWAPERNQGCRRPAGAVGE